MSNLVTLTTSDRADVRICNHDPSGRTLERKVDIAKVAEFVLKNLVVNETVTSSNYARSDSKPTGVLSSSSNKLV